MQQTNNSVFADIHTHILPGIDDGAKTAEESLGLILEEKKQGITDIVLTPHFHLSDTGVDEFLARRNTSFDLLREKIIGTDAENGIRLHLGAEVRYDPNLIYTDIYKLCIGSTSYLLLELTGSYPFNFEQTVYWLLAQGVTPILAHIERYDYLYSNPTLLDELLNDGVIFQCNATSLLSRHYSGTVKKLVKKGYVQVIASDAHNLSVRPPMMEQALKKLRKYRSDIVRNSAHIICDRPI